MDRRSIIVSMHRKNSIFSLYIQGLWRSVMRLAKRVALVPPRKSLLCSCSKCLLSILTSQALRWGYKNNEMCFIPTKSLLSCSFRKAIYVMLRRIDSGLVGFNPWPWSSVASWPWAIYLTALYLASFFCQMEIIMLMYFLGWFKY